MANEIDKLGPKDFITGCLVIIVAIVVVPILVLIFKVSIYLAIVIGVDCGDYFRNRALLGKLSGSSFSDPGQMISKTRCLKSSYGWVATRSPGAQPGC